MIPHKEDMSSQSFCIVGMKIEVNLGLDFMDATIKERFTYLCSGVWREVYVMSCVNWCRSCYLILGTHNNKVYIIVELSPLNSPTSADKKLKISANKNNDYFVHFKES